MQRRFHIVVDSVARACSVERDGDVFTVECGDGRRHTLVMDRNGEAVRAIALDGTGRPIGVRRIKDSIELVIEGEVYLAELRDPRSMRYASVAKASGANRVEVVKAPMPGMIVKVLVAAGDTVTKGQPLAILNAMKLENDIRAPRDGTIKAVHVTADQPVEKNAKLVELE